MRLEPEKQVGCRKGFLKHTTTRGVVIMLRAMRWSYQITTIRCTVYESREIRSNLNQIPEYDTRCDTLLVHMCRPFVRSKVILPEDQNAPMLCHPDSL